MNSNEKMKKILEDIDSETNRDYLENEVGINPDADTHTQTYSKFLYFGDCRNTVDKDNLWDATQMAGVIRDSSFYDLKNVVNKIHNGQRKIPKILLSRLSRGDVVCGINVRQRILWIYDSQTDIHYFFDVK